MVFSSLNFLFLFFPAVLILHGIVPNRLKNPVLLIGSLLFYAWGEPVYVLLMILSIALNYTTGLQLNETAIASRKRYVLGTCIAANLAILFFFKYASFLVETCNGIFGTDIVCPDIALPIGISFYTFQALSYIIDVYRGNAAVQTNAIDFALYISMFPQLVAGPIVKYTDIAEQLKERKATLQQFGKGLERVGIGLIKKVILANNLGMVVDVIQADPSRSVLTAWLGAVCYMLQIYFDFSGYSDMAIGMGKMMGFTFPENFDHPYMATSITDFWRRWHISLSQWFRDYVYIPLGGNRVPFLKHIRNLLIVWFLTGLWHGASWNFVLWGLYYGVLLILEKYVTGRLLDRLGKGAGRIVTLLLVCLGWVLFSNTDFVAMRTYLGNLFGQGGAAFWDPEFLYLLRNNLLLLLLGILSCTTVMEKWYHALARRRPLLGGVFMTAGVMVCIAYLVYGSYNPFLYFRF